MIKSENRYIIDLDTVCIKCGHKNTLQMENKDLYNSINMRFCDVCKSKDIDVQRL